MDDEEVLDGKINLPYPPHPASKLLIRVFKGEDDLIFWL